MTSKLFFYGGVGSVTGSNFVLETNGVRYMVDCGMEQGTLHAQQKNAQKFAYDPYKIKALFVTHAHLDHIGRIPKLVHEGFGGTIYSTPATLDLARLIFEDALHIMRDDFTAHGVAPLYSEDDVIKTLAQWNTMPYHHEEVFDDGLTVMFKNSGHILGSAMVQFSKEGRSIVFTGDIGNSPSPLLQDPESIAGATYVVMESVYGDKQHEHRDDRRRFLKQTIEDVRARKGVLLIPAFSIERTQVILFELDQMVDSGELKPIPLYVDAPLGSKVTEVYRRYPELLNAGAQEHLKNDADLFTFKGLTVVHDAVQSRAIEDAANPKILLAGAGMSHGGRIKAHEKRFVSDPNATILFSGYQAAGSLGRQLQDGARSVIIDGQKCKVRAHMATLTGYSAHKDRDGLIEFASEAADSVHTVFVCMGEPRSSLFLAQRLHDFLGLHATCPGEGSEVTIEF